VAVLGWLCSFYSAMAAGAVSPNAKPITVAPLVLYPACPCYHAVGEGNGRTRIDAAVNVPATNRTGLKFVVELRGADGKQIQTATADASKGDSVGTEVSVPVEKA